MNIIKTTRERVAWSSPRHLSAGRRICAGPHIRGDRADTIARGRDGAVARVQQPRRECPQAADAAVEAELDRLARAYMGRERRGPHLTADRLGERGLSPPDEGPPGPMAGPCALFGISAV